MVSCTAATAIAAGPLCDCTGTTGVSKSEGVSAGSDDPPGIVGNMCRDEKKNGV